MRSMVASRQWLIDRCVVGRRDLESQSWRSSFDLINFSPKSNSLLHTLILLHMRPTFRQLNPSPRVLEYLLRKGRLNPRSMAVVAVDPPPKEEPEFLEPPPKVAITPCDPWPRPYILDGNLRRVAPYHYTYNTYCKQRWRGREILEIFADEFRDRPVEYYVCQKSGPILLVQDGGLTDTLRKML